MNLTDIPILRACMEAAYAAGHHDATQQADMCAHDVETAPGEDAT